MALRAVGRLVSQRLSRGASRNFKSNAVPSENDQVKSVHKWGSNEILEELDELTIDCMHRSRFLKAKRDSKASYINIWTVYFSAALLYFGQSVYNTKRRSCSQAINR